MKEEQHLSSILDFINGLEKNYPVSGWKLFGFHIWPVLRISLGMRLSFQNYFKEKNQITSSTGSLASDSIKTVFNSAYNSINDSSNNQNLNSQYDIVFLNVSSTRYYKLGNKWFNPFSDPFINYLEKENIRSLVLEYPDVNGKTPRYRPSKYIGAGINLMNLNVLFERKFEKVDYSKLNGFAEFLVTVNLPPGFFLTKILRVLNYSVFFEKILRKVKPSLVIVEGFYSYIAMGLVLAARKQKIKCVDIQHGVQSENDFLFSKWLNLPDSYELLPDIFWCWSNVEKENIDEWTTDSDTIYSSFNGGNPVLELDSENEFVKSFESEIEALKKSLPESINVLYTHQATYDLSDTLIKAIKNSPENWLWWIRFHPQYPEAQSKVEALLEKYKFKNVIFKKIAEFPLLLLLRKMDLHVTEYSSSVLEAEMLGVPSIILNISGTELFSKQINSGTAKFVKNEKDFYDTAVELVGNKKNPIVNENRKNFISGIEMIKESVKAGKRI